MKNATERWRSYGLTVLLTLLTLLLLLASLGVEPFGGRAFLWADSDQYLSIGHYFGSMTGKNDCFYSWNNPLGGNALSQMAYYSASPLNVLFLFLNDRIFLAAQLITYLKILGASLSFCYCLRCLHRDGGIWMKALLSVSYAFSGYMMFYGWNASWMDGIVLLPILYIGIIRVVQGRRGTQYILTLALALISNFYIGFMLCLASVLLYLAALLLYADSFMHGVRTSFFRWAAFSVIGGCMAMFILLPTYLGVPNVRKLSIADMLLRIYVNTRPAEVLSGLFTGQTNTMPDNAPLIYVGVVPLMLTVLLFVCKKASLRKKLVYGALLLFTVISFENSFLNKLWHGLSDNSWFNFRYSFFMSFVLLLAAYEAYAQVRAKAVTRNEYLKTGVILLLIAAFVLNNASEKLTALLFFTDLLLIGVLTGLLAGGHQTRRFFAAIVVLQMLCGCVVNGYWYLKDCDLLWADNYDSVRDMMEDARASIRDDSFYRMEKTFMCGRCDGNLYDFNGISNIASTENLNNLNYLKRLGARLWHPWGVGYTDHLPEASESLLGMKYLLTNKLNGKDYDLIGSGGDIGYYRNPNALPILFPSLSIGVSTQGMDNIVLQNTIWRSINGIERDVFLENTVVNPDGAENGTVEVAVEHSGSVYLYAPGGYYYSFLRVRGDAFERDIPYCWDNGGSVEFYYVGELKKGDTFTVAVVNQSSEDSRRPGVIRCFTEDKTVIAENAASIRALDVHVEEVASSHLEMTYKGDRACVASTIPYDEGWRVYDNGTELTTIQNWDNFLSFALTDAEEHRITLIYRPAGFRVGLTVSLLAAASFFAYVIGTLLAAGRKQERSK